EIVCTKWQIAVIQTCRQVKSISLYSSEYYEDHNQFFRSWKEDKSNNVPPRLFHSVIIDSLGQERTAQNLVCKFPQITNLSLWHNEFAPLLKSMLLLIEKWQLKILKIFISRSENKPSVKAWNRLMICLKPLKTL